jgi:hypothetical protein
MLPGQCGECLGRKTPYAPSPGTGSPFGTGTPPDDRAGWQRRPDGEYANQHLHSSAGPKWFTATYDGDCSRCGGMIVGGVDMIRSDEQGGWECCEP